LVDPVWFPTEKTYYFDNFVDFKSTKIHNMTKDEIKRCLREFAQGGYFQQSKHCRDRMLERQITTDDVLKVLLWGQVTEIEYNQEHGSWQCKVTGTDVENEPLVFIAGIYEHCYTVRCITVY